MFKDAALITILFLLFLNSDAKVIHFLDIRKQFITFLFQNITDYNFWTLLLLNIIKSVQYSKSPV